MMLNNRFNYASAKNQFCGPVQKIIKILKLALMISLHFEAILLSWE
jgi:hypothetical protein